MKNNEPLVSIGMPVYNGASCIRQALDSILAQSYKNIEIDISDNASTDGTEEICRAYLAQDSRVRYHRNPRNMGLMANWRRVLQLASGKYFMWLACDDYCSINYITILLECLLIHPKAILAAPKTIYINDDGSHHKLDDPDSAPASSPSGNLGTAKQLLQQHAHGWLHGLFRRDELLRVVPTFFAADPWGADMVFLLELCVSHEIVGSDAAIMHKRATGISGPKTPRQRVKWQCWFARALLQVIRRSLLSGPDKRELFGTYVLYLKWLYFRRGIIPWATLWGKAGLQCLIGINRP